MQERSVFLQHAMYVGVDGMQKIEIIREQFLNINPINLINVLIATSFTLTIEFRTLRVVPASMMPVLANGINELQHKLLSQTLALLTHEPCYPNDVFIDVFFEIAENCGLTSTAVFSLSDAISKFNK
jgi:hypothetical protein